MLTQIKTNTTFAAGLPGLKKTMRSLAGMASALALAGAIGVGLGTSAEAAVITSQAGTPAATGSTVLGDTLTGGFTGISDSLGGYIDAVNLTVPEPGTLAMFGLGLAGLGFMRRRQTA